MEINDESPTNHVAKKLVDLLNTSHKPNRQSVKGYGSQAQGLMNAAPKLIMLKKGSSASKTKEKKDIK